MPQYKLYADQKGYQLILYNLKYRFYEDFKESNLGGGKAPPKL